MKEIINKPWEQCCKDEVKRIWEEHGGPMNIIKYITECPVCKRFIGLTQTSEEEAERILKP